MNGCPHPFSFALPVPLSLASLPWRRPPPHPPLLILDCSCPPPLGPSLLRHPHYYSLSGAPLLSLLTERFHRRLFSSGLVSVCRLSLYRILSSTGAPYEARVALRSPRERINECFTLSPAGRPVCFRARANLFCHYPLCFLHILRSTILFSLPSLLPASQFFAPTISLPCVFRSVPRRARLVSVAIPNLV